MATNPYWEQIQQRLQQAFQGLDEAHLRTLYSDPVERARQMWDAIVGQGKLAGVSPFILKAMGNVVPRLVGQQTLEAVASGADKDTLTNVGSYLASRLGGTGYGLLNTAQGRALMQQVIQQQRRFEDAATEAAASGAENPLNNLAVALLQEDPELWQMLIQASLPIGYGGLLGRAIQNQLQRLWAAQSAIGGGSQQYPWSQMLQKLYGQLY